MATRKIPNTDKLPAISVRQPCANMIMMFIKDLEFRVEFEVPGPMLIHASNSLPSDYKARVQYEIGCTDELLELQSKGCYLGVVDIVDVFELDGDGNPDSKKEYAFEIGVVFSFDEPVPGKGLQISSIQQMKTGLKCRSR
ncbi:MAG: hypothetical protein IPP80_04905 [Ignavibacteria bacterium]|nr:hypothetical protein [Ignavibacteria bacterium]